MGFEVDSVCVCVHVNFVFTCMCGPFFKMYTFLYSKSERFYVLMTSARHLHSPSLNLQVRNQKQIKTIVTFLRVNNSHGNIEKLHVYEKLLFCYSFWDTDGHYHVLSCQESIRMGG